MTQNCECERSRAPWPIVVLALSIAACRSPTPVDPHPVPDPEPHVSSTEDLTPRSGEEALDWLLAGNHRFWDGHPRHEHESSQRASVLHRGQLPFAVILGCADSRVAPELIFDHGLGDLFVVRVAGNFVGTDEAASIEYAVEHLHCPLVVVLGHQTCGAVTAALGAHENEPAELVQLLDAIAPGLAGIPRGCRRRSVSSRASRPTSAWPSNGCTASWDPMAKAPSHR